MLNVLLVAIGICALAGLAVCGLALARSRKRRRLFGPGWRSINDLVRFLEVGGAVVYAARRLYPQAVGDTPGMLKGAKQYNALVNCANMLDSELGWIDDAPGLDSCDDAVWQHRLSTLRGGMDCLAVARVGLDECIASSPSEEEFFEACGKLMLVLDLTQRSLLELWSML